jgi:Ribbon-helix-helix protein, copG family.
MHNDAPMHATEDDSDNSAKHAGTRITVTLPGSHYDDVMRIAKAKRVSASWVVRDAVEKYLTADIPLFAHIEGRKS